MFVPRHRHPLPASGWATRRKAPVVLSGAAVALLAVGVVATLAGPASAADARVGLGTASSFAVLAGSTVTNTGPSVISGDVGLSPGTGITGFPPGVITGGTQHIGDGVALTAKDDLVTAYNDAAGRPTATDVTGQDLGGKTLTPGVYEASTAMALTGTLTLDAQGNPAAVFIFKAGTTLVTASSSKVTFVNGGSPCNVFWQVGSSATLGTGTQFVGTIMALTSATLGTAATVEGRVLARNGAVTLDSNVVTAPNCSLSPSTGPSGNPTATSTTTGNPGTPSTTGPSGSGTHAAGHSGHSGAGGSSSASPASSNGGKGGTGGTSGGKQSTVLVPQGHPHTGLGGSQPRSGSALFLLAGLCAVAAALTGAWGFRRTERVIGQARG